eukprot:TRINITY_DN1143_c0_g1_i1.p1 TRINITY_DN1143_c0_g1~~TRINITY_DN1143_c0_g1_i1.p1  ORF type:complete len:135 (-),score=24.61 TRINITY_DN1143_c0_g1_i1:246-650(-)
MGFHHMCTSLESLFFGLCAPLAPLSLATADQAFFSEVVFHHEPSQCLLCTDVYWNYPRSAPPKTQLWKFGMDVVYLPIYRNLLVADAREFDKLLARISAWNFNTVVPCHGRVVTEAARDKFFAFLRRGVIGDQP